MAEKEIYLEMKCTEPLRELQIIPWPLIYLLTLMLLVANLNEYKMMQKSWKMTETLAHGYLSESTPRELSNEYQHDRV